MEWIESPSLFVLNHRFQNPSEISKICDSTFKNISRKHLKTIIPQYLQIMNIAWIIGAAVLGFLIAWVIRGTKVQAGQVELESTSASLASLEQEHTALQTTLDKLNAKHSQLTQEHNSLKKTRTTQEAQVKELEQQVQLAKNKPTPSTPKTITVDNSYEIRSLEVKVASLERDIAYKEQELERLNEENENLATKLDVADAAVEDAQSTREKALTELKRYESYRPRFEEANLERNAIKYKYEQLLAAQNSSTDVTEQLEAEKAALVNEVAQLKTALDQAFEQRNELQNQLTQTTEQHKKRSRTYDDLQLKYDTLLRLQERTEAKLKALEVNPE